MQSMFDGRMDAEYQRVQHFITHAPWDSRKLWKRLREVIPERVGVLVIDDTGFHKQGDRSVGVSRQYCPPLGKVANCQIAVTSILRSTAATWPLAMELYLPEAWTENDDKREVAHIPEHVRFRKKWEIAVAQATAIRAEGFTVEAVTADAGYGDVSEFRDRLDRSKFLYVVRVSGRQVAFTSEPRFKTKRDEQGHRVLAPNSPKPIRLLEIASSLDDDDFRRVRTGNGSAKKKPDAINVTAIRIQLAHDWSRRSLSKKYWLLIRRKDDGSHKLYLSNFREDASLEELVRVAYSRWAIEQNYQQLKDELGFDHFEGRSWPGWNHHAVLTALAFTFIGLERRRDKSSEMPSVPAMRKVLAKVLLAVTFIEDPELRRLFKAFSTGPPPI